VSVIQAKDRWIGKILSKQFDLGLKFYSLTLYFKCKRIIINSKDPRKKER